MPFKSEKQRRYLYKNEPAIAKKWTKKYGSKISKPQKRKEGKIMAKRGLYANIHAKRKRIKAGSGEKMRKIGSKGAPTAKQFKRAAKTAKK